MWAKIVSLPAANKHTQENCATRANPAAFLDCTRTNRLQTILFTMPARKQAIFLTRKADQSPSYAPWILANIAVV